MGISLSGTEAWRVDDRLPPASYIAKAATVERTKSKQDNPQVQVDWRVLVGEFTGAEQTDWITLTDPAMGRVVMLLEAAGIAVPDTEFENYDAMADWLAKALDAAVVEMVIRLKDDRQGRVDERTGQVKQWPEIVGYRRPSASDIPGDPVGGAAPQVKDDKPLPF